MNLCFVVEGRRTERAVYRSWIAHAFPRLEEAHRHQELSGDRFWLVTGGGIPAILDVVEQTVADLESAERDGRRIERLFVCLDAEDTSIEDRREEVEARLQACDTAIRWAVVVQDCCIESWFLGNARIMPAAPRSAELRRLKEHYDVSSDDPERMPAIDAHENRAAFHLRYLKELLWSRGLTYSKRSPGDVGEAHYMRALVERRESTGHLASFGYLLEDGGDWEPRSDRMEIE